MKNISNRKVLFNLIIVLLIFTVLPSCEKKDPATVLDEHYSKNDAVDNSGWQYYAAHNKDGQHQVFFVYIEDKAIWSPKAEFLQRLCPDKAIQEVWEAVSAKPIELNLIENPDYSRGKAKRKAKFLCDSNFDLALHEKKLRLIEKAVDARKSYTRIMASEFIKVDKDIESYYIEISTPIAEQSFDSCINIDDQEFDRALELISRFAGKKIDTKNMDAYYPEFSYWLGDLPFFKNASRQPPNKDKYEVLFYQDGYVRVGTKVENNTETLWKSVFYNELGAPVLAFNYWGSRYYATVFEYDIRGYLRRMIKFVDGQPKPRYIDIYAVGDGYSDTVVDQYSPTEDQYCLAGKTIHKQSGSWQWNKNYPEGRTYTDENFEKHLSYPAKYSELRPILPYALIKDLELLENR